MNPYDLEHYTPAELVRLLRYYDSKLAALTKAAG